MIRVWYNKAVTPRVTEFFFVCFLVWFPFDHAKITRVFSSVIEEKDKVALRSACMSVGKLEHAVLDL